MKRLVSLTEYTGSAGRFSRKEPDTYLIDPVEVGAVLPRTDYTTLLVQGKYFHVVGSSRTVMDKLGLAAWM